MRAKFTNNINARSSLGKGEVVSSILTGSTINPHKIGTSPDVEIPISAVAGRTYPEDDAFNSAESVDSVHGAFRKGDRP